MEILAGEYIIGLYLVTQVAMATAAKAKLLLRELKTVKADLAFAKERCAQLEEENKILRESRGKGDNPADDDLVILCAPLLSLKMFRYINVFYFFLLVCAYFKIYKMYVS